ncbi:MAG: DinB family protein [Bacteroidota bacterium]|nr:DinB family protein [Bacteroidota bacterium]
MDHTFVIDHLSRNSNTYNSLLSGIHREEYLWRPEPEKWCLLEIVCHLYDEEQFDFRARTKHVLENIQTAPTPIDPEGWVKSRKYIEQNYDEILEKFLNERKVSVDWLNSLTDPKWNNKYVHPEFGPMAAEFFLANWLAHDLLHFRQIITLLYNFTKTKTRIDFGYAGAW